MNRSSGTSRIFSLFRLESLDAKIELWIRLDGPILVIKKITLEVLDPSPV
jgi:hypothetical protein